MRGQKRSAFYIAVGAVSKHRSEFDLSFKQQRGEEWMARVGPKLSFSLVRQHTSHSEYGPASTPTFWQILYQSCTLLAFQPAPSALTVVLYQPKCRVM